MSKYGYLKCSAEHGRVTNIIHITERAACSLRHKDAGCSYFLSWVPTPWHKRLALKILGKDFK